MLHETEYLRITEESYYSLFLHTQRYYMYFLLEEPHNLRNKSPGTYLNSPHYMTLELGFDQ